MSIQLFVPTFEVDECLSQIRECLEKGWTGLGFKTVEIEKEWCSYAGVNHSHFLNSNTSGLHLAFHLLKTKHQWADGDEVITTPLTFVSTNHAIQYVNLKPVFADIDDSLCLDPESIESRITPKTRAVIFVGLGGNIGQYQKVVDLCQRRNLALILDAAHMAGTRMNGQHVGKEADVTVFSFQAVKNLPTADSGMICFSKKEDDDRARKLTWLGINKDTYSRTHSQATYKWMYDVEELGFKYHGNSIMAAIALVQLKHLEQQNAFRRSLAGWYRERLQSSKAIQLIPIPSNCSSASHLFQIRVKERDQLITQLNENGIYPGVHYRDNTEYRMYSYAAGTCPRAHKASGELLSLPMHLRLTRSDVDKVCDIVLSHTHETRLK